MRERGESGAAVREEAASVVGCLLAVVAGAVGFWVWFRGARPGIHGGFEGERDLSLVAVELPLMTLGTPLLVLTAWALTRRTPLPRAAPYLAALLVLALCAWAGSEWLAVRVSDFVRRE